MKDGQNVDPFRLPTPASVWNYKIDLILKIDVHAANFDLLNKTFTIGLQL